LFDLALTPSGHLALYETEGVENGALPESLSASLRAAFGKNPSEFLLRLATLREKTLLPPAFAFWRSFSERYLTALCHIPELSENLKRPLPPPQDEIKALAEAPPPMWGGEYLNIEALARFCLYAELGIKDVMPSAGLCRADRVFPVK
jgi:hypothetical protein